MNTAKPVIFALLVASCNSHEDQTKTLERVYVQNVKAVIQNYERMYKTVNDSGNRPKDVALLRQVDSLQNLRKKAGITFNNLDHEYNIDGETFKQYLALANYNAKKLMVVRAQKELISTATNFFAKYQKYPSSFNLMNCLINLMMLENLIIDRYRIELGSDEGFYSIIFNVHSNCDTLKRNSNYKMILSLKPDVNMEFWNVKIDSLVLTRNDTVLSERYKFENIGGMAYFEYGPRQKGTYTFSGDYKMTHKREDFAMQERFLKQFVVR